MGDSGAGDRDSDGGPVVNWCAVGYLDNGGGSTSCGADGCALGDGSPDRCTLGHADRGALGFYNCRHAGFHDCSATNFHDRRPASCSYWRTVGCVTGWFHAKNVTEWPCIEHACADGCAVGCEGSWDVTSLREDGLMRGYLASRNAAALAPSVNLI